jgi:putative FmdB family regulatory protein
MPIYEYRCGACGAEVEAIQKMSDAPLRLCKSCGAEALARVMSRTSFHLKGSGWYATDYKAAPRESKSETAPSAPAAPTPTPTATKSE